MKDIEQLKVEVRAVGLPSGWTAASCFMLAMASGRTSDEMVSVMRDDGPLAMELFQMGLSDIKGRNEVRRAWRDETKRQADGLRAVLEAAGFVVRQDGGSLYVTGRNK